MTLKAAVPSYLGKDFSDAPPGHRFGLYFQGWKDQEWNDGWSKPGSSLDSCKRVLGLPSTVQKLSKELRDRQWKLSLGADLSMAATSVAPFTTGLGNEHPTENGFSFLNPYGIPYLPGSGIKGVMRSAARHQVKEEDSGWSEEIVERLFGKEGDTGYSGALVFWDVYPEIRGHQLSVEIMNPHYNDYYQKGGVPHDAGSPLPIPFLTVPEGSEFIFHVQCLHRRLNDSLPDNWKAMIEELFTYAFEWVGFGAKTSVGYGAMTSSSREEEYRRLKEGFEQEQMSDEDKELQDLRDLFALKEKANDFPPGGEFLSKWVELLKNAVDWKDPGLRKEAYQLLQETFHKLPWKKKTKKKFHTKHSNDMYKLND